MLIKLLVILFIIILFAVYMHKSHIWEKSVIAGFSYQSHLHNKLMKWPDFVCWYKFMKFESWLERFWVGMSKNGWCYYSRGILKKCQRWIDFFSADNDTITFGYVDCPIQHFWVLNAAGALWLYLLKSHNIGGAIRYTLLYILI